MVWLKRAFLIVMVAVLPWLVTRLSAVGAVALLSATHRYIDPRTLQIAGIVEFVALVIVAVLEARDRWTDTTQS